MLYYTSYTKFKIVVVVVVIVVDIDNISQFFFVQVEYAPITHTCEIDVLMIPKNRPEK